MRISDWSSDVCSSDLRSVARALVAIVNALPGGAGGEGGVRAAIFGDHRGAVGVGGAQQQEGDEDRQQGAERDQDALASQQRAARRWRLKLIIVDHPALPDPASTLAGGPAGSMPGSERNVRRTV